jgi:IS5 family transposase
VIREVNEWILIEQDEVTIRMTGMNADGQSDMDATAEPAADTEPPVNQGKLLLDATCAPTDIASLTYLALFNESREKLDKMIDVLRASRESGKRKPRTYREKACKAYLAMARQRQVGRVALPGSSWFVARDLRIFAALRDEVGLGELSVRQHGKAKANVEFGAKVAISLVDEFARMEQL